MSDEDKAAIDTAVQAVLDSSGDAIPALYVGVWDPERGSYVAAYGDAEIDAGRRTWGIQCASEASATRSRRR
jgi:hypothetical protein